MFISLYPTYTLDDCAHQGGEDELGEEHHGADNGHIRPDASDLEQRRVLTSMTNEMRVLRV